MLKHISNLLYEVDHEVIKEVKYGVTVYRRGAPIKVNRIKRAFKRLFKRFSSASDNSPSQG